MQLDKRRATPAAGGGTLSGGARSGKRPRAAGALAGTHGEGEEETTNDGSTLACGFSVGGPGVALAHSLDIGYNRIRMSVPHGIVRSSNVNGDGTSALNTKDRANAPILPHPSRPPVRVDKTSRPPRLP